MNKLNEKLNTKFKKTFKNINKKNNSPLTSSDPFTSSTSNSSIPSGTFTEDGYNYNIGRIIPGFITISALCSGLTAIRYSLSEQWEYAIICIIISCLLDALDGRVARYLGYASHFGAELDSLSDLVCFGVVPSLMLYLFTMHTANNIGWGVCLYYTVCCAIRLARFNTDLSDKTTPQSSGLYFTGVPSPLGAMIAILPIILFLETRIMFFTRPIFCLFFLIIGGSLMISKFPTFATKKIKIQKNMLPFALLILSIVLILVFVAPWVFLSIFIICYLCSIPLSYKIFTKK